jgi:hypothetical protein
MSPVSRSKPTYFPFLDLPRALRLRIYGCIPHETDRYHQRINKEPGYIIETTRANTAILQICRGIRNEAKKIVAKSVTTAASIPPRITIKKWCRDICLEIDTICSFIHERQCFFANKDDFTVLFQWERDMIMSRGLAFDKAITRIAQGWPNLEIVLPITGFAVDVYARWSCLWHFLKIEHTRVAMGLEIVICMRRSEWGAREEALLRKNLNDMGVKLAVKMLEE